MAFRLKNGTSIGAQLSRIVAKELRTAIDEVKHASTTAKSVHETRKHIKKIRSVLHLFRKELGSYYKALDERIRFAARQLSDVRDAETLVTTMETLRREHGRLVTAPIFKAADSVLKTRRDDSYGRLGQRRLAVVRRRLVHSRRVVPARIRAVTTGRTMREGVKRGYRRARAAMDEATAGQAEDVRFHEWRRRVKDHWYQLRLVEGINGKAHRRVRRLKQLQDWLGDDHNLVVLRNEILASPHQFGDAHAVGVILGCIDVHLSALRRRAVRRGRQLFAKKPASFEKHISGWFG
jgi:CHAD domain-containing protein